MATAASPRGCRAAPRRRRSIRSGTTAFRFGVTRSTAACVSLDGSADCARRSPGSASGPYSACSPGPPDRCAHGTRPSTCPRSPHIRRCDPGRLSFSSRSGPSSARSAGSRDGNRQPPRRLAPRAAPLSRGSRRAARGAPPRRPRYQRGAHASARPRWPRKPQRCAITRSMIPYSRASSAVMK
jgi:hypothetical protein